MVEVYEAGHHVVVSFSAGKDSGVCLEVCLLAAKETGNLPLDVVMRDEEINRMLDDLDAPEALADDEFSNAWVPDIIGDEHLEIKDETEVMDGKIPTAMTKNALETVLQRERKLDAAKTEEERQMIRKDSDVFRISLMFSGDEAVIVKGVLGKEPAKKLVEICKKLEPVQVKKVKKKGK